MKKILLQSLFATSFLVSLILLKAPEAAAQTACTSYPGGHCVSSSSNFPCAAYNQYEVPSAICGAVGTTCCVDCTSFGQICSSTVSGLNVPCCSSENLSCSNVETTGVYSCCIASGGDCTHYPSNCCGGTQCTAFPDGHSECRTPPSTCVTNGAYCDPAFGNTQCCGFPDYWCTLLPNGLSACQRNSVSQGCGDEGEPCCNGDCEGTLVCSNDPNTGDNICVPNFVLDCDQYCTDSSFQYGTCGVYDSNNPNCPRPPDNSSTPLDESLVDCTVNGAPYDCFCCNQYTPFNPFAITITPILELDPRCGTNGVNTAIGCIPLNSTTALAAFLLRWGIGIGAGLSFLLIIFSGFQITTSAGKPQQLQGGKDLLTAAIAGLIMLIFSVFLLQLIGVQILHLPGF